MMVKPIEARDLPGLGRLSLEAVQGVTDLVENMHKTILNLSAVRGSPSEPRTSGITGMVYRNIRSITRLVGTGLDPLLDQLGTLLDNQTTTPEREALQAALNGVLGDHLAASKNPLAIPMQFRQAGKALDPGSLKPPHGKLLILVHGLCMNDLQWSRMGHDHGAALRKEGFTPVYLHYNTGRHISENGLSFAQALEGSLQQIRTTSSSPPELFILAHSMGGLVSRSACFHGNRAGHQWPHHLRKLIFLGSPHHGALLEKGGNILDTLLEINPYSAPFSRLGKIRSSGITDLRYGLVMDQDWQDRDRFEPGRDQRTPLPLPENVDCHTVAGTIAAAADKLGDDLLGDGLVTLDSALGRHPNPAMALDFPTEHQWISRSTNHSDLLNHSAVHDVLSHWLRDKPIA